MITVVESNDTSVLWFMIQYILMALAEVMVSVSGLEFAYTQAPKSFKSFVLAVWFLTTAVGYVLILVTNNLQFFDKLVSS